MKVAAGLIFCAIVFGAAGVVRAGAAPGYESPSTSVNERVLHLPAAGEEPPMLEVTLFTPDGSGPFPLAVLNHGSIDVGQSPADIPRVTNLLVAYYFLSRGYAVALPMLRGYAGSGGAPWTAGGCDTARFGIENARDVDAVMQTLAHEPDVDASRVIVAGQSLGGWVTLAQGTLAGRNVKGLISFAGGVRETDCDHQDLSLAIGAARLGRLTRIPSIWFYGDNDALFPPGLSRAMLDAYTANGGPARFVDIGVWPGGAHQFTASDESLKIWTPRVDAFLASVGLPNAMTNPRYLPTPPPPPSRFAAIDDVDAVPTSDVRVKAAYRQFLAYPLPRVFVLSKSGVFAVYHGFDPLGSTMRQCRQTSARCAVYAYDNDVVWTGLPAASDLAPAAAQGALYSMPVHPNATTRLAFFFSLRADCSVRGLAIVTVTRRPAHGVAAVAQIDDFVKPEAGSAFAACGTARVPGVALTYTPAPGFTGTDTLAVDSLEAGDQERSMQVNLVVK